MRKTDFEFKYLGSCPVCACQFQARGTKILSRKPGISQIYAQCTSCKSSIVVFVLKNSMGLITTIGMLTDMNKDDIVHFSNMRAITSDEVLELHEMFGED